MSKQLLLSLACSLQCCYKKCVRYVDVGGHLSKQLLLSLACSLQCCYKKCVRYVDVGGHLSKQLLLSLACSLQCCYKNHERHYGVGVGPCSAGIFLPLYVGTTIAISYPGVCIFSYSLFTEEEWSITFSATILCRKHSPLRNHTHIQ